MTAQDATPRAPRYATEATIVVGAGDEAIRGQCKNLSAGGLCSELESELAIGEAQELHLSLVFEKDVESEPLSLRARPVWCTQIGDVWQVGFQFLALDEDQKSFLQMFLRYLHDGTPGS